MVFYCDSREIYWDRAVVSYCLFLEGLEVL
jgi:hypothetical protein